ncbi:hypothetical protein HPB49_018622 [Dermacentor silvarum]|uniref:Uncharacterized protein n=1 Tax=Dermacentor silvarum TaxID=543639 RepID=A0ACB8D797_DERSI|nr:hypothetical protein HPB49_018622 [Dermacentor silvarum]
MAEGQVPEDAPIRPISPEHDGEQAAPSVPYTPANAYNFSDNSSLIHGHRPRRGCLFTSWVFCVVGAITMVVPLALLLLPLVTGQARYTFSDVNTSSTTLPQASDGWHSPPPGSETPTVVTDIIRQAITANMPASCRRDSPRVSDDLVKVNAQPLYPATAVVNNTGSVFCLYNNSRFRKPKGHDFLTVHVPWWFCSHLIYWSVGIDKGKLTSRAPNFDRAYGLYKLRTIADTYRVGVELLMTIGGYPEDTGQFYSLGSGTNAIYSLASDVVETVYYSGFNGVNIHLVEDPPCERHFPSKFRWLSDFIDELTKRIQNNFATVPFKIAVMVGANRKLARNVVRYLEDRIHLVFYDTQSLVSTTIRSLEQYCSTYSLKTQNFLRELRHANTTEYCKSLSFILPSRSASDRNIVSPAHTLSRRDGFASRLDFCAENRTVVNASDVTGCTSFTSGSPWEVSGLSKPFGTARHVR